MIAKNVAQMVIVENSSSINLIPQEQFWTFKHCNKHSSEKSNWSMSRMLPPNCSPRQNHSLVILNVFIILHKTIAHGRLHVTDSLSTLLTR